MNKICTKCLILKPLNDFYSCSKIKDGFKSHCKICFSNYFKKLYSIKKEVILMRNRNWLTQEQKQQINIMYKNTPKGHEVDHIIPINGKIVSGLHVPWNLQYLTKQENNKKSNKL